MKMWDEAHKQGNRLSRALPGQIFPAAAQPAEGVRLTRVPPSSTATQEALHDDFPSPDFDFTGFASTGFAM
jgi:hypothetical protein